MEDASMQAVAQSCQMGSQAVVINRDEGTEADIELTCENCNVNPVTCRECTECAGVLKQSYTQKAELRKVSVFQNELVAPPVIVLCFECNSGEAFVQGGRCSDCVSYPQEHASDHRSTRGVRIGGGYDVLHVTGEHGRMAAAREAVRETVRADSPSRMAHFYDDSPWQYVHGAPSTFSSPDRFHTGMLPRQPGHATDRAEVKLPPACKKRVVDAEAMVRASLMAMNREAPTKSLRGEPYLYRVMAPSTRKPESNSHRPLPRESRERSTPMGNAFN